MMQHTAAGWRALLYTLPLFFLFFLSFSFAGGDYDVTIPEDTVSGEYQIRVGRYEGMELYGCSGTFEIVSDVEGDMSMSFSFGFSYELYY